MKGKMFEKIKTFLFRIIEYFKKEEVEDLSSVIGIALQDRVQDNPITVECFDEHERILRCIAGEDLEMGDWVTFSEDGKVKKFDIDKNNNI